MFEKYKEKKREQEKETLKWSEKRKQYNCNHEWGQIFLVLNDKGEETKTRVCNKCKLAQAFITFHETMWWDVKLVKKSE